MAARYVRFGYSRTTSTGSRSVPVDQIEAVTAELVADPGVVNAYYYPHPSSAAVWVKGDSVSHAALSRQINDGAR